MKNTDLQGKIVLMSCCAPCSAGAIRELKSMHRDIVILFYNPNIYPKAEYDLRMAEQQRLCKKYGIKFIAGDWDHDNWVREIKGLEGEPECGARCAKCFAMRARFGARWARENGYDVITSCFGVSPHKDQKQVDQAFINTPYEKIDFTYSPEPDAYRQKYCGCEFSETYNGKK